MSSFDGRTNVYLFDLKNGKKRLAYGRTPEEALEVLSYRMSAGEMDEINRESFKVIHQREVREWLKELG